MTREQIRSIILEGAAKARDEAMATIPHGQRVLMSFQQAWDAAKSGIVAYRPAAWLGRKLTGAESITFCRELEAMQRDGLIQRKGNYGRTVQIQLLNLKDQ